LRPQSENFDVASVLAGGEKLVVQNMFLIMVEFFIVKKSLS